MKEANIMWMTHKHEGKQHLKRKEEEIVKETQAEEQGKSASLPSPYLFFFPTPLKRAEQTHIPSLNPYNKNSGETSLTSPPVLLPLQ